MRYPQTRVQHPDTIRDVLDSPLLQARVERVQAELGPSGLVIMLGLCSDGAQSNRGKQAKPFSLLCTAMYVVNLPPHLRTQPANSLMVGIVPGGKEPKDMQPYLQIIADELLWLWEAGVTMWDAGRHGPFVCVRPFTVLAGQHHGSVNHQAHEPMHAWLHDATSYPLAGEGTQIRHHTS